MKLQTQLQHKIMELEQIKLHVDKQIHKYILNLFESIELPIFIACIAVLSVYVTYYLINFLLQWSN